MGWIWLLKSRGMRTDWEHKSEITLIINDLKNLSSLRTEKFGCDHPYLFYTALAFSDFGKLKIGSKEVTVESPNTSVLVNHKDAIAACNR